MPQERLSLGLTVKVLLELDTVGEALIRTQLLNLSEETCSDPVQLVLEVFVVMVEESIDLEKITVMLSIETGTEL